MNKKIIFVCIYILCVFSLSFLITHLNNIEKIVAWYTSYAYIDTDKKIALLERQQQKGNILASYYLADTYKHIDIDKAIEISEQYITSERRDTEEIYLHHLLLGELYFYVQNYQASVEHYWLVLQQEPFDDNIRYNYEIAYHYLNNIKNNVDEKVEQDVFERHRNTQRKQLPSIPKSLENTINQSQSFKHYVKEKNSSNTKQW